MLKLKSPGIRLAFLALALVIAELALAEASPVMAQNRWDQVTTVTRRARPRRVIRNRPRAPRPRRVERVPLLTVQLRLLMQGTDGQPTEVNRLNTFFPGQRLRLGVMSNQNGYLAIFRQAAAGADAQRIFPDARANAGSNFVTRNVESIVPSNCATGVDCWYPIMGPAGNEVFTIIFSRDEDVTEDIIEQATRNGGRVTQQILDAAVAQSGQRIEILSRPEGLARNNPAGVHAAWFRNINRANSEDIILVVPLSKGSPTAATTAPDTPSAPTTDETTDTTTETTNTTTAGATTETTPAPTAPPSPATTTTSTPNSTTTITTTPSGTTRIRTTVTNPPAPTNNPPATTPPARTP